MLERKINSGNDGRFNLKDCFGKLEFVSSLGALYFSFISGISLNAEPLPNTLPTGASVINGNVNLIQNGNTLNVNAGSLKSIVNYQSFSVGRDAVVNFNLPNANAAILNRVVGGNVSEIFGQINSNGKVFLTNPSGVIFGNTSQVNVGSMFVSTLGISDEDFLAGNYRFEGNSSAGKISNFGVIKSAEGGEVVFLASAIENAGNISSEKGSILFGVGKSIELDLDGGLHASIKIDEGVSNRLEGTLEAIKNEGLLSARGGYVKLQAYLSDSVYDVLINNSGTVESVGLVNSNGSIELVANSSDARGLLVNSGTVNVSSEYGEGGNIKILGDRLALLNGSEIDASGLTGGGEILIGGDYLGSNPAIQNAKALFVQSGANISSDAKLFGDGGKIILWSDEFTSFHGNISAQGGLNGGDGGFVEVSSKNDLIAIGQVELSAANGKTGTLLYDPYEIEIRGGERDGDDDTNGSVNELINDSGSNVLGLIDYFDEGVDTPITMKFVIYESEIENTNANISLRARNSISTLGIFDYEIAGEGIGVLLIQPNNNFSLHTSNGILDGAGSINVVVGGPSGAPLTIQTQGSGTIEMLTDTDIQHVGASNILVGNLISEGSGSNGAITLATKGGAIYAMGDIFSNGVNDGSGIGIYSGAVQGPYSSFDVAGGSIFLYNRLSTQANNSPINIYSSSNLGAGGQIQINGAEIMTFGRNSGINIDASSKSSTVFLGVDATSNLGGQILINAATIATTSNDSSITISSNSEAESLFGNASSSTGGNINISDSRIDAYGIASDIDISADSFAKAISFSNQQASSGNGGTVQLTGNRININGTDGDFIVSSETEAEGYLTSNAGSGGSIDILGDIFIREGNLILDAGANADDLTLRSSLATSTGSGGVIYLSGNSDITGNVYIDASTRAAAPDNATGSVSSGLGGQFEFGVGGPSVMNIYGNSKAFLLDVSSSAFGFNGSSSVTATSSPAGFVRFNSGSSLNLNENDTTFEISGISSAHGELGGTSSFGAVIVMDSDINLLGTNTDFVINLRSSAISVLGESLSGNGGSLSIGGKISGSSDLSDFIYNGDSTAFAANGTARSSAGGSFSNTGNIQMDGAQSTVQINLTSRSQSIFSDAFADTFGNFINEGIISTVGSDSPITMNFNSSATANIAFQPGSYRASASLGGSPTVNLSTGRIYTNGDRSPITISSAIEATAANSDPGIYFSTTEVGRSAGLSSSSSRGDTAILTSGSQSNVLIDFYNSSGQSNYSFNQGRGELNIENSPFDFIYVSGSGSSIGLNSVQLASSYTGGQSIVADTGLANINAPIRSDSDGEITMNISTNLPQGAQFLSSGTVNLNSEIISSSSNINFAFDYLTVQGDGSELISTPQSINLLGKSSTINLNNVNAKSLYIRGDSINADIEGGLSYIGLQADNSQYVIHSYLPTFLLPSFIPNSTLRLTSSDYISFQYLVAGYADLGAANFIALDEGLANFDSLYQQSLLDFGLPSPNYSSNPSGYDSFFNSYLSGLGLTASTISMMTYDGFIVGTDGIAMGSNGYINLGDNTSYARNNLAYRAYGDITTGTLLSDGGNSSNILSLLAEQGGNIVINGDVIKSGFGNLEIITTGFGSYSSGNIDVFGDVVHSTSSAGSLSIRTSDSQGAFGSSISSLSTGYINVTGDISILASSSSINLQTSSTASTAEASFVSSGQAGNITIGGDVSTFGDSSSIWIDTQSRAEDYSFLNYVPGAFSNAGNAGDVQINGSIISLGQGSSININTGTVARGVDGAASGSAGDVSILGTLETFTNSNININTSSRADLTFLSGNPTVGFFSIQSGQGGNIDIQGDLLIGQQSSFDARTNSVALSNGTSAVSQGGGNLNFNSPVTSKTTFGSVNFTLDTSSIASSIESEAFSGNGGNITFNGGLIAENLNLNITSRSEARGFTEAFSQKGGEISYGLGTDIVNNSGGFLSFYSDSSSYSQSSFGNSFSGLAGNQTFNGNLVSGGISFVTTSQSYANIGTAQSNQAGNITINGDLELNSSFSTMNFVAESVSGAQSGNSISGRGGEITINGELSASNFGDFISFNTISRSNTASGSATSSEGGNLSFSAGSSVELSGNSSSVNIYTTSEAYGTDSAKSSDAGNLDLFGDIRLNSDTQNNIFVRAESMGRADSINDVVIGRGGDVNIAFGGSLTGSSDDLNGSFNVQSYAFDSLSSSQSYGRGGDIFVNGLMRFEGDSSSFFVQTSNGNFTGSGSIEFTKTDSDMNIFAQGKSNIIGSFTVDSEGEFGMRIDEGTILLNVFPDQLDVRILSVGMNEGNATITQNADQLRLEVDGPGLTPNFNIVEVDDVLLLPQYFGDGSATIKVGGNITASYFIGGDINVSTPGTLSFVSTPEGQLVPGTDFQVDFVFLEDFLTNTLKLDSSLFNLEGFSVSSGTSNFTAKNIALDYTTLYAQDKLNLIASDFVTANSLTLYPKLIAPDIFIDPIQVGSIKAPIGIYGPTLNNIQIVDLSNQTGLGTTINYTTLVNNIIKDPFNSSFYLYPLLSYPVPPIPPVPPSPIPPTPGFFDVSTYELEFSVYDNYDTNLPFLSYSKIAQPAGFGTTIVLDTPTFGGTFTSASSLSLSEMPYKDTNFALNPSLSLKDVSRQGGTMIYVYEKSNNISSNDKDLPNEKLDESVNLSAEDGGFVISEEMSEKFNKNYDVPSQNQTSTQTKKSELLNSYNLIDP
jgi:filamentous hemagglutinin family protein